MSLLDKLNQKKGERDEELARARAEKAFAQQELEEKIDRRDALCLPVFEQLVTLVREKQGFAEIYTDLAPDLRTPI
ncbi:MAG: hypothetical protein GAK35_02765 [Herbaspirillum frisingense]|uniref:Uncharacterized protein n=1 Tax=Herbaspirillum frisingense TaxID=92645 RepID=A0A7V8JTW4_9BURK|nr:MAG: hypothetical protein GAK35_02765 [Herbaspirillum frisingense]